MDYSFIFMPFKPIQNIQFIITYDGETSQMLTSENYINLFLTLIVKSFLHDVTQLSHSQKWCGGLKIISVHLIPNDRPV